MPGSGRISVWKRWHVSRVQIGSSLVAASPCGSVDTYDKIFSRKDPKGISPPVLRPVQSFSYWCRCKKCEIRRQTALVHRAGSFTERPRDWPSLAKVWKNFRVKWWWLAVPLVTTWINCETSFRRLKGKIICRLPVTIISKEGEGLTDGHMNVRT